MFTCWISEGRSLWFVIVRFRSFSLCYVWRFVACDRSVSGNNRPLVLNVCFVDFYDLSYSCHLQASAVPPFFDKNSLTIIKSFAVLEQSRVILRISPKLGEHVTLWFALTPPKLKWLTEQKNPTLWTLQKGQRDTTKFAVNKKKNC